MVKSVEDTRWLLLVVENQTKPGISDHYSLMTKAEARRCVEAIKTRCQFTSAAS